MNWNRLFRFAALAVVAIAAASCARQNWPVPETTANTRVWPALPDEPRIRFVKTLSTPSDIGHHPSGWSRVAAFLVGDSSEHVQFRKPFGIAVDEAGNLCVTDTDANTVSYLDFKRKQWQSWKAVGKTRFAAPVAVARQNGIFYVADSELRKVIAFDQAGREQFSIGAPLQRPVGLAVNSNALAVVDSVTHTIYVFDLHGTLRFQFGKRGVEPGEFNFPTHISADHAGHWLVTDSLNSRLQIFDADGKFITQFGGSGDTPGNFARPKGVAADSFGHVYVADSVFDIIQIFDFSGRLLLAFGGHGAGIGEFGMPNGIAISADNQIYVTDSYNRRVQVFQYIGDEP